MNKIKNIISAFLILGVAGLYSCKDDDLEIIPEWESGVHGFGKINSNFQYPLANKNIAFDYQWISVDKKATTTKVDFYLTFSEDYVDSNGDPQTANHGEVLWKTVEGSSLAGNRENMSFTITQSELYELFKNATFDYDDGNGEVSVFNNPPDDKPRTTTARFITDDNFQIRWEMFTTDGRKFDSWSNSVCTELPGANCAVDWGVSDATPVATISLAKNKPLKGDTVETLTIKYSKPIKNTPTITARDVDGNDIGELGTVTKVDATTFKVTFKAPVAFNGTATIRVTGAISTDDEGALTQAAKSQLIDIDNQIPVATITALTLGRNQTGTITVTFNENMVAASTTKFVQIAIDGTTRGIESLTATKMTVGGTGNRTATINFKIVDEDYNATSGPITLTFTGTTLTDIAGNVATPSGSITLDVDPPAAPNAGGAEDLINKLRLTPTATGEAGGELNYLIVKAGSTVTQATIEPVPGVFLNNGFSFEAADRVAQGKQTVAGSGSAAFTIDPFTPNGDFEVYYYVIDTRGNVGPISSALPFHMN